MNTPIHDFLVNYANQNPVRAHMPGGKSTPFDITEISGADSLFECDGIIMQSEENASSLFGSAKTLYSCGGSTLAVQAMLALAKANDPSKNRVAASRYCHKSLASACILLDLDIDWIESSSFLSCKVSPDTVEKAITPSTLCVFIQSIDYYGGECDIAAISQICKKHGIPLLADNAHGAYKVFTHDHPLLLGADLTADSAHKTLPCLTGGAYLHISKNAPRNFSRRAKEMMSLFGSSSPSYLILDSLDLCNRHIALEKEKAKKVIDKISELKVKLAEIGYALKESDLMRITIDAGEYGYSGFDLCGRLEERNIFCEYADQKYVVMLFSTAQPLEDFTKILAAAKKIPKMHSIQSEDIFIPLPERAMTLREAFFSETEQIPATEAAGRVCGAILAPCPPCVPVIMPGEIITAETAAVFKKRGVEKISVVKNV